MKLAPFALVCVLAGVAGAGPDKAAPTGPKGVPAGPPAAGPKGAPAGPTVDPATQAKADVLFEKAQANFQGGQYQAAIELFKQAYDLVRDPVYLFNIAQAYRKVLDCVASFDYYNRYLAEAPNAENSEKVRQWLRELQPCVEQREKEQEAARRGEQAEQQRREEELQRRREAARPVPVEVDRGGPFRIAGMVTGAVGLAGLAVGITYGVKSSSLENEVADRCSMLCDWGDPEIQDLDARGERANTLAKVGYIGGGILTLAGASLYVLGRTRVETIMVTPSAGGATVSASITF